MSPRATTTVWSLKADELLADGEWHDGLEIARAIARAIPPGIAERRTEYLRARNRGQDENTANPRQRELSLAGRIASGQRSLAQQVVHNRLREGSWELDVSEIPADGWRLGGWRVRDARVNRRSLNALAELHNISKRTARKLLMQDPPLKHKVIGTGRVSYVTDLEGFAARVAAHRAAAPLRRGAASRAAAAARRGKERTELPVSELARRSQVGIVATQEIRRMTSGTLPWRIVADRRWYLPVEALPEWEKAVEAWRAAGSGKRRRRPGAEDQQES